MKLFGISILSVTCLLASTALAQDLGTSKSTADVEILSFDAGGGSAIIADRLGDKYVCEVAEKRAYSEIGGVGGNAGRGWRDYG